MDRNIVIYFFVVLFFIKNIFKDLKLLLYFILSGLLVYGFVNYNTNNYTNNLDNISSNSNQETVYSYGNIQEDKNDLDSSSIEKLDYIKGVIDNMDINNRSKIELYSNLKKFLHIYNNYYNYHYKKNWFDNLEYQKKIIFNKISSLNVSYSNKDEEVENLFNIVDEFIDNYLSKIDSPLLYDNLNNPSGFNNSKINKYELF